MKINDKIKQQWEYHIKCAIDDMILTPEGNMLNTSISKACDYFLEGGLNLKTIFLMQFLQQDGNDMNFTTAQVEVSWARARLKEKKA